MSDAHANPAALQAALADARALGCDRLVLLGDVTGYGYDVRRTLALVRENFDIVLMGNHDSACTGLESPMVVMRIRNYDIDIKQREDLSEEELEWLRSRPRFSAEGDAAFVHADFTNPSAWNYIFSAYDAFVNFHSRPERILFCGHTHHAAVWEMTGRGVVRPKLQRFLSTPAHKPDRRSFALKDSSRYIVNVGSVGHPRADRCSTYAIYDADKSRVIIRRLPVDLAAYEAALIGKDVSVPLWLHDAVRASRCRN